MDLLEKLTVSADRKFLDPPGSGHGPLAVSPPAGPAEAAAARVAAAGADALLLEWPFDRGWIEAARPRGSRSSPTPAQRWAGYAATSFSRADAVADASLDTAMGRGSDSGSCTATTGAVGDAPLRAASDHAAERRERSPVAGFVDDVRTGRGASEVVVGRIDASDPGELCRHRRGPPPRRPPPAGGRRAGPRHRPRRCAAIAADLGAAGLLARTQVAGSEEHLDAVASFRGFERERFVDAPLITAVVCVRDAADVLEPCLRLLLAQRYPRVRCWSSTTEAPTSRPSWRAATASRSWHRRAAA